MNACWSVVIGLLAIAGGTIAAFSHLNGEDKSKQRLALLGLLVLIVSVAIKTGLEIRTLERTASFRQFDREKLPKIDEASGAAVLNDRLYVVDDEESRVFDLNVDRETAYETGDIPLRTCPSYTFTADVTPADVLRGTELEDVAAYEGKLFLLSSHALASKEKDSLNPHLPAKRALLMEMTMQGPNSPCISRATSLRTMLRHQLGEDWKKVNLEGLAVTAGTMYVGFRSPLVDGKALVLAMPLDAAFAGNATPRRFELDLRIEEHKYAIVGLAAAGADILILGNSSEKEDIFKPRVWRWRPNTARAQPPLTSWEYGLPEYANAKAEGIALGEDYAWVVLDAPRWGGVRRFPRSAIQ